MIIFINLPAGFEHHMLKARLSQNDFFSIRPLERVIQFKHYHAFVIIFFSELFLEIRFSAPIFKIYCRCRCLSHARDSVVLRLFSVEWYKWTSIKTDPPDIQLDPRTNYLFECTCEVRSSRHPHHFHMKLLLIFRNTRHLNGTTLLSSIWAAKLLRNLCLLPSRAVIFFFCYSNFPQTSVRGKFRYLFVILLIQLNEFNIITSNLVWAHFQLIQIKHSILIWYDMACANDMNRRDIELNSLQYIQYE